MSELSFGLFHGNKPTKLVSVTVGERCLWHLELSLLGQANAVAFCERKIKI